LDCDAPVFQSEEVLGNDIAPALTKRELVAHCEGDSILAGYLLSVSGERHPFRVLAEAGGPEAFLAQLPAAQLAGLYGSPVRYARASCRAGQRRYDIDLPHGFDAAVAADGLDSVREALRAALGDPTTQPEPVIAFSPASSMAIAGPLTVCMEAFAESTPTPIASVRGTHPLSPRQVLALVHTLAQRLGRLRVDVGPQSWLHRDTVIARDAQLREHIAQEIASAARAGYRVQPMAAANMTVAGPHMTRFQQVRPGGHATGFHRSEHEAWLWAVGDRLGTDAIDFYATILNGRRLLAQALSKQGPRGTAPTVGTVLHDWHGAQRIALVYDHLDDCVYHTTELASDARMGHTYLFARGQDRQELMHTLLPLPVAQAIADDLQQGLTRLAEVQQERAARLPVRVQADTDRRFVVTLGIETRPPLVVGEIDLAGRAPILRTQPLRSWADAEAVAGAGVPLAYPLRALDADMPAMDLAYLQVVAYRALGLWSSSLQRAVAQPRHQDQAATPVAP
jgi:hypothetical protein